MRDTKPVHTMCTNNNNNSRQIKMFKFLYICTKKKLRVIFQGTTSTSERPMSIFPYVFEVAYFSLFLTPNTKKWQRESANERKPLIKCVCMWLYCTPIWTLERCYCCSEIHNENRICVIARFLSLSLALPRSNHVVRWFVVSVVSFRFNVILTFGSECLCIECYRYSDYKPKFDYALQHMVSLEWLQKPLYSEQMRWREEKESEKYGTQIKHTKYSIHDMITNYSHFTVCDRQLLYSITIQTRHTSTKYSETMTDKKKKNTHDTWTEN